ncbi:MAG: T9SS type A sorting domain-containing protein [Prolixibacteraceae bacterium]|nr:T9SS type A sorting domain-containing protein [Prolixibacteraceae bacterium]
MKISRIIPVLLLIITPLISFGLTQNPDQKNLFQENESVETAGLKVYPNPVKENKFTVSAEKVLKEIELHNILGQKTKIEVTKLSLFKFSVLMNEKKKGIYLVTVIFDDDSKTVQRIIVN